MTLQDDLRRGAEKYTDSSRPTPKFSDSRHSARGAEGLQRHRVRRSVRTLPFQDHRHRHRGETGMSINHMNEVRAIARAAQQIGATLPKPLADGLAHLDAIRAEAAPRFGRPPSPRNSPSTSGTQPVSPRRARPPPLNSPQLRPTQTCRILARGDGCTTARDDDRRNRGIRRGAHRGPRDARRHCRPTPALVQARAGRKP